jgi:hypothetical protein
MRVIGAQKLIRTGFEANSLRGHNNISEEYHIKIFLKQIDAEVDVQRIHQRLLPRA